MDYVYHYTSRQGYEGILKSRSFRSTFGLSFGKGVYFTRLSPHHSRKKILANNYSQQRDRIPEKVKYVFAIPRRSLRKLHCQILPVNRDVCFAQSETPIRLPRSKSLVHGKKEDVAEYLQDQQ